MLENTLNELSEKKKEPTKTLGIHCLLIALLVSYCSFNLSSFEPNIASKLRQEGRFDEAVKAYERHIENRLADEDRKPEENPFFYYLLIGDTYLDKGDRESAELSYLKALENKVEKELVADRFRLVAKWLEKKDELQKAIDLLHKHRDLDELFFDSDIDRLHKLSVEAEEKILKEGKAGATAPSPPPQTQGH